MEPEDTTQTLNELFEQAEKLCEAIKNSTLDSSEGFQTDIEQCRCRYEHLTVLVSEVGLFSDNESIDELPTSSIKFLLLPARLGELTLKRKCQPFGRTADERENELPDRISVLKYAYVYYVDFLTRCKDYGLINADIRFGEKNEASLKHAVGSAMGNRPSPEQLLMMAAEREEKIKRYKENKILEEKLATLRRSGNASDENLREFYLLQIQLEVNNSLDELKSIRMEQDMLERMTKSGADTLKQVDVKPPVAFQPFLLTRDEVQKKVYGMGYPSLPVMSVDDLYEKRAREGWWPSASSNCQKTASTCSHTEEEDKLSVAARDNDEPRQSDSDEEASEQARVRLQRRDEYRDTHRTGWGNTYNRS